MDTSGCSQDSSLPDFSSYNEQSPQTAVLILPVSCICQKGAAGQLIILESGYNTGYLNSHCRCKSKCNSLAIFVTSARTQYGTTKSTKSVWVNKT